MKVVRIETFAVVVPMRPDTVNGPEYRDLLAFDYLPKYVLRVHMDSGLTGIGETPRQVAFSFATIAEAVQRLLGTDPLGLNLQDLPLERNAAYGACEMALYDVVGQALGVPAHRLLGGAYRDRVEIDYWTGFRTPEDTARKAREGWELGFKGIKLKGGLILPPVERVRAIAKAVPEMEITLDPNCRFDRPIEVVRLAEALDNDRIVCFEDPLPKDDYSLYAEVRQRITIPLCLHLSRCQEAIAAIRASACDYFNFGGAEYLYGAGGMAEFVRCAQIAAAAGMPCWHGSGVDLGLLDTAALHAAAASAACTLRSDLIGNLLREDDLLTEPIRISEGFAQVPQAPGLGVRLDLAALERYGTHREEFVLAG